MIFLLLSSLTSKRVLLPIFSSAKTKNVDRTIPIIDLLQRYQLQIISNSYADRAESDDLKCVKSILQNLGLGLESLNLGTSPQYICHTCKFTP